MGAESVSVRAAAAADAASVAAVYRPYVVGTAVSFEEQAPSADEMRRRIEQEPRLPWLVAVRQTSVVGFACASPHRARPAYRWSVDVSVYLTGSERGRGTGRLLYRHLLEQVGLLGYVSAHAGITLPNEPSVRLHESLGFTRVGVYRDVGFKLGRWQDVGWWSLRLVDEPPVAPREPRPWAASASAPRPDDEVAPPTDARLE